MKNKNTIIVAFVLLVFLFQGLQAQKLVPDVTVSLNGEVTSIQAAIDAAPSNSDRPWVIYIREGIYNTEKLIVPFGKDNITLVGESRENTVISYHIYDCTGGLNNKCPAEDAGKWSGDNIRTSATLTILGNGFRAENLTIQNTAGPVGQALAITVKGDRNIFINCNFIGYQDTIYLWDAGKRSYFEGCLVVGRTDYIYGAGIAWFEACEIRSFGGGWITAPSTPETQEFGYVFNNCNLTYATGSPRSGDDGALVALGRPWHEYPKVTWMNSYFPAEIHPQGWPTIWNMEYAPTSNKLELYEYNNTGPGADMSGRADWVGIRELTAVEAAEITIENVFNAWDPTADAPLVQTYAWTGNGENSSWLLAENWDPSGDEISGVPEAGEAASAEGAVHLNADGGSFTADLALSNGANLLITENSTVNYLTLSGAEISIPVTDVSLDGRVATKGNSKFTVPASGVLRLNATLTGLHTFSKEGAGKLILPAENVNFSGAWIVSEGVLEANAANAMGKGSVKVKGGAGFIIGHDSALQPSTSVTVETGASLILNATVVLSEFYLDDQIQAVGEYTSTSHPNLIIGSGKIIVGRPEQFTFIGGNWDDVTNFRPQLLPEAGEKVLVEGEMETTSNVFVADMVLTSKGNIRMRGDHTATGEIKMQTGSKINYATGGQGFNLTAPMYISGDVTMEMNSGNEAGNALTLSGNIRGDGKVTVYNHGGDVRLATLKLGGDNSNFFGIWDLTRPSRNASATTAIEGLSANAFGAGSILAGAGTQVIFSHANVVTGVLNITLNDGAIAILNQDVVVETLILNGEAITEGVYSEATHPGLFEGTGSIVVGNSELSDDATLQDLKIGSTTVEGFSANQETYNVELPAGTTEVNIEALPNHVAAEVEGEGTVDVSSGSGIAEITVTAQNGVNTKTYTINITVAQTSSSNEASLMGIKVNNVDLPGFSADQFNYTYELSAGTTEANIVATPVDANAQVVGTATPVDVSSGTGTATLVVTAQDGVTTLTYSINFTVAVTGLEDLISKGIQIYPIPATTELNFSNAEMLKAIHFFDMNGKLLKSKIVNGAGVLKISTADLANGIYILTAVLHSGVQLKGKFIKK